jgi:hypothetical protein
MRQVAVQGLHDMRDLQQHIKSCGGTFCACARLHLTSRIIAVLSAADTAGPIP